MRLGILLLVASVVGGLAALVAPVSPVHAAGLGVFPQELDYDEVLRGGTYTRSLGIINDSDGPITARFVAGGDAGSWVTVVDAAIPELAARRVTIAAGTRGFVAVRIDVPADAANGRYEGSLTVESSSPNGNGDASLVAVSVEIPVSATVTGTQRIDVSLIRIDLEPTEVGQPLRYTALFENSGNVAVRPTIVFTVVRDGEEVHGATGVTELPIGSSAAVGEWDTTGAPAGGYLVRIEARVDGETIGLLERATTLEPRGFFTRNGELRSLRLGNDPVAGGVAIIEVDFANTGEIETRIRFTGTVIHEGAELGDATGVGRLVPAGGSVVQEVFVDVPEPGSYIVEGSVAYDDKVTGPARVTFVVADPESVPFTRSVWPLVLLSAGGALWVVIAVYAVVRRTRMDRRLERRLRGPRHGA